jgi:hypothetical protein
VRRREICCCAGFSLVASAVIFYGGTRSEITMQCDRYDVTWGGEGLASREFNLLNYSHCTALLVSVLLKSLKTSGMIQCRTAATVMMAGGENCRGWDLISLDFPCFSTNRFRIPCEFALSLASRSEIIIFPGQTHHSSNHQTSPGRNVVVYRRDDRSTPATILRTASAVRIFRGLALRFASRRMQWHVPKKARCTGSDRP